MIQETETKNAYFAGLFDGEGSIGIYATNNGRKTSSSNKIYWSPKLAIVGTYRPQIEAAYLYFGVGQLSTQKRQALSSFPRYGKFDTKLCRQGWRWMVTSRESIIFVLEKILPYLMEKKEQAMIVLQFCRGEISGEVANQKCKDLKKIEFPSSEGEPVRQSRGNRISWKQANEIRELFSSGVSQKNLLEKFNISQRSLHGILSNKTYTSKPLLIN